MYHSAPMVDLLKGKSIWQTSVSSNCSWSWRKLLQLRDLARQFVVWNNGEEVWKITDTRFLIVAVWQEIRPKKEVNGIDYCGVLWLFLDIQLFFEWQSWTDYQPWTDSFLGALRWVVSAAWVNRNLRLEIISSLDVIIQGTSEKWFYLIVVLAG